MNDALAQIWAMSENYEKAASYCAASIEILSHVYGDDSVELGREYFKLAQLYFNGQQILEAMDTIERAKGILKRYLQPDHEDLKELEKMRKHLLSVIESSVGAYWST